MLMFQLGAVNGVWCDFLCVVRLCEFVLLVCLFVHLCLYDFLVGILMVPT